MRGLALEILESSEYSLRVFLIPKLENNPNAADLSVEFVPYDPGNVEQMEHLQQVTALIKAKQVPVASKGLLKPKAVVAKVQETIAFRFTMDTHTRCWKHYKVRPPRSSEHLEDTKADFCIYDELAQDYGYTEAWVNYLSRKLADAAEYEAVVGKPPVAISASDSTPQHC